jgi:hypothetical protein
MDIEVAVPSEFTTKEKGGLLEQLAADFMKAQGYEVDQELRVTALELDLFFSDDFQDDLCLLLRG